MTLKSISTEFRPSRKFQSLALLSRDSAHGIVSCSPFKPVTRGCRCVSYNPYAETENLVRANGSLSPYAPTARSLNAEQLSKTLMHPC